MPGSEEAGSSESPSEQLKVLENVDHIHTALEGVADIL